jgi:hypothetical protein
MDRPDRDRHVAHRYLAGVDGERAAGVTTFIVCAVVFVGCIFFSWRLGKFIAHCDERQHDLHVTDAAGYAAVKEAGRITREAAKR